MDWLALFAGVDTQVTVAGMFGGLLRWIFFKAKGWDGIGNMIVGAILGYYVSPYAVQPLGSVLGGLTDEVQNVQRLSALILGILGVGVIGFLIDWGKHWFTSKLNQGAGPGVSPSPPKGEP